MEKNIETLSNIFKVNPYIALVVFCILLLYLFIIKTTFYKGRPWLIKNFIAILHIGIIGGLLLAYSNINKSNDIPKPINNTSKTIIQAPTGDNSPAIADVTGNVTINQNGGEKK